MRRPCASSTASKPRWKTNDDGLVYAEQVFKAKPEKRWTRESFGSRRKIPGSNTRGTSLLMTTSQRIFLRHLDSLEPASLEGLDWSFGKKLWEQIQTCGCMTFETWRAFTIRYFAQRPGNLDLKIPDTSCSLDTFITDLRLLTSGTPFLTFLTIHDCRFPSNQYLALGELPNLTVLKLWESGRSDDPSGFNERILRAWSENASEKGAFRSLRAIEVTDFDVPTSRLLTYFEPFRNLTLCRCLPSAWMEDHTSTLPKGSWEYLRALPKRRHNKLTSGDRIAPETLLSAALTHAALGQNSLPYCNLKFGDSSDKLYSRSRPEKADVWARTLVKKQKDPERSPEMVGDAQTRALKRARLRRPTNSEMETMVLGFARSEG